MIPSSLEWIQQVTALPKKEVALHEERKMFRQMPVVSLEIAKLLEPVYNWGCDRTFTEYLKTAHDQGRLLYEKGDITVTPSYWYSEMPDSLKGNEYWKQHPAPTLAEAEYWLRQEHDITICITPPTITLEVLISVYTPDANHAIQVEGIDHETAQRIAIKFALDLIEHED